MKKFHRAAIALLTLVVAHIFVPTVAAHPLGNFTINHYAGLHVSREAIVIDYVLDMAEIPAFQEIAALDANGNGQPDPVETAGYHPAQCEAIGSQLDLRLNSQPVALNLDASAIEFPPGAGGLLTLRLTCGFSAPMKLRGEDAQVEFATNAYAERLGWREIVVTAEGLSLRGDFASTSLSQRLTAYPQDLLTAPLNQRQVRFEVDNAAVRDFDTPVPRVSYRNAGKDEELACDFIAGCDGFHGVCRAAIPAGALTTHGQVYPFAWLGILAGSPPPSHELIYAHHDRGFALFSMRGPSLSRLYLQCAADEDLANWPDDRIWLELHARLGQGGPGLKEGPVLQKGLTGMRSFVADVSL